MYIHRTITVRKLGNFWYGFLCKHIKKKIYLITNNCTVQFYEIALAEQMQLVCNVIILF